nr:VanZ family protein [Psychromicrobium silvestre]
MFGYGVLVLLLVLWPSHVDAQVAPGLSALLDALHRHGVPGFVDYGFIEVSANVLMFVPLGLFLAILLGRRWYLSIPALLLLSSAVELTQQFFLPGRTGSWSDVVANTSGAALGACLVGFLILPRSRTKSGTEVVPPER